MIHVVRWGLKGLILLLLIPCLLLSAVVSIIFWDAIYVDNVSEFGNYIIKNRRLDDI